MNRKRPADIKKAKDAAEKIEEKIQRELSNKERELADWAPKTALGKQVKNGTLTTIDEILVKDIKYVNLK